MFTIESVVRAADTVLNLADARTIYYTLQVPGKQIGVLSKRNACLMPSQVCIAHFIFSSTVVFAQLYRTLYYMFRPFA